MSDTNERDERPNEHERPPDEPEGDSPNQGEPDDQPSHETPPQDGGIQPSGHEPPNGDEEPETGEPVADATYDAEKPGGAEEPPRDGDDDGPEEDEREEEPEDEEPPEREGRRKDQRTRRERERVRAREADDLRIAFVGGTGPEGLGLAMRFAKAGHLVFIGSRSEERANEAVEKVKEVVPQGHVFGGLNEDGVERADIIFLCVPSDAHQSTLESLADLIDDKILVDVVVPMLFDRDGPKAVELEEGSAAQQARAIAERAKVVSGFHHLDGRELQKVDRPMQGDVIVCSDHKGAKKKVMELVEDIEYVRAVDGGGLANSKYTEQLTVLLIHMNKIYKAHSGVRITGF